LLLTLGYQCASLKVSAQVPHECHRWLGRISLWHGQHADVREFLLALSSNAQKSIASCMSPLMVVSNHRDVYGQCRLLNAELRALTTLLQRGDFSGA